MGRLGCFRQGAVLCELDSTDKYAAIHELIYTAPVFRKLKDKVKFEEAVVQRERIMSTAFGHGVAVAHGRSACLDEFVIALGISRKGVDFDSPDGLPVNLLFVVANPPHMQDEYLYALSELVKQVRRAEFRQELLACAHPWEAEAKLAMAIPI